MAQGTTLPGDTLIITAFISYVGCFTKQFRLDLLNKLWLPYLRALEVLCILSMVVSGGCKIFFMIYFPKATNSNHRRT